MAHVDLRVFSDVENCGGYLGQLKRTHMVICTDENDRAALLGVIAHETGHYYWNSRQWDSRPRKPRWASEGAANFFRAIVRGDRDTAGNLVYSSTRRPCTLADNIVEYLQLPVPEEANRGEYGACRYALGTQLFLALYHGTDHATFRAAFRDFYLGLQSSPLAPIRDLLRDAFAAHATEDQLAAVDRILEERYGPSPN